jgi:glycosyltransferase involved in cell wall biosynthesis
VLALPSLKEGWGLVVMEAAGYAVPTVGYAAAGGVAESVVDGVTGILVDDEAGFTAALRRLLDDPELRRRMGMAAEARTWEFGWDTAARSFARVLARAAGRPELETALEAVPEIEPAHIHHDPVDPPAATDPGTTMAATP